MALHVSGSKNALPSRFSAGNPFSRFAPLMLMKGGAMRRSGAEVDEAPLSGTLGRIGSLEVRLARGPREVWRAQRLRYRVFYQERCV